ncbi:MAG: hypothetical protein IT258_24465 [Saprospiraceae bacterium]|nr:hypothetical protein [Saprospiraceae bacterium]
MQNTDNPKIPLDIPADQRLYVTYALWSLAKHIKYEQDDFILEAAQQITKLDEHMVTCHQVVENTPKTEPYMLSAKEVLAFFICFDLCHKVMNGPEHFNLMMQYQDEDDEICVSSFNDALRNKERCFEILEPFLYAMNEMAEKNPDAHQIHQYIRIAKRLPQPGSKGVRHEYAPFDEQPSIPDGHAVFKLSQYHHSPIIIELYRSILIDMHFHLVFHWVNTIIEIPDNLPSRIISAYLPDFRHYFHHMFENINLQQGTNEQFNDLEKINKTGFRQQLPEVVFGSIYIAFDLALKLCFSDKGYSNYPALIMDRFGLLGEKMFGQQVVDNSTGKIYESCLPILTDYFSFLTKELDHKGSTFVADYQAFAKQVDWWD